MKFNLFLIDYLQTGQVSVPRHIEKINADELNEALLLLEDLYHQDHLEMPLAAPEFNSKAALWSAQLIFHIIQLILIRDAGEEAIAQYLMDYEGEQSPEAVYSADLLLRAFPDLFRLSRGLSPEDQLVTRLKEIAQAWPFSSVGIENINTAANTSILHHPSLRQAYIDRIIEKKDINRLKNSCERELLQETLGSHQALLWPDLPLLIHEPTQK